MGESVNDFITDLNKLLEKIIYGNLQEEFVRNRIVVDILDGKLSNNLQMIDTLKLEEATNRVKSSELIF